MKIQEKIRHFIDNMNAPLSEINLRHDIKMENSVKAFLGGLREEYEIKIHPNIRKH